MSQTATREDCEVVRQMLYLGEPSLWPAWPLLPLVRRRPGRAEEYGFLFDLRKFNHPENSTSTVFLGNIFEMPANRQELLRLPQEDYADAEAVYAAGWRID
jgi:hypothetical protein